MKSLSVKPPQFSSIDPNFRDFMNYNRDQQFRDVRNIQGYKILCDVDRICEIEDSVTEWILYLPEQPPHLIIPLELPDARLLDHFEVV